MGIRVICDLSKTCNWITASNKTRGYWRIRPEIAEFMDSRKIPFRANSGMTEETLCVFFPEEHAKDAVLFKLTWGGL